MSLFPNRPLQVGVAYLQQWIAGAVNAAYRPQNTDSFPFGSSMADGDVLPYGSFVALDTLNDIKPPVATVTTVNDLVGVIAYKNNGIMEYAGFKKGGVEVYVPALTEGRIVVPVTTGDDLNLGATLGLNLTAGTDFNTVCTYTGNPNTIDISSIASVATPSASGLVEITIKRALV